MITITGPVIPGDQRGRELGFPTANMTIPVHQLEQAENWQGVWAGIAECEDGTRMPATVSIGRRPTFYGADGELLLEAFILDFCGDLYGRTLNIHLHQYIRGQLKFTSIPELIECMEKDVEKTRGVIKGAVEF